MRKTILISCCAVVLILAVISFLLPMMGGRTPVEPSSSTPTEVSAAANTPSGELYTIKEYQGNIAVYMEGVDRPFRITDVDVRTLPQLDQERLESGIQVSGADELNRLLEDYCS
ncbi:MAG: hypothetical protein HFE39_00175 [Clostridiales bacterium]|nr:hypothetical protein [Clostridiales bacterium]